MTWTPTDPGYPGDAQRDLFPAPDPLEGPADMPGNMTGPAWTEAGAPWGSTYRWRIHRDRLPEGFESRPKNGLHLSPDAFEVQHWTRWEGGSWSPTKNRGRRDKLWDHLVREHLTPDYIRVESPEGDGEA